MLVSIQGLWATLNVWDVIDILVVAYFLYRIYLMLKNTRAGTLTKGVLLLLVFTAICKLLNLHVISWLLDKSTAMLMVALPIVFQPELRRALERIGRWPIFGSRTKLTETELEEMLNGVSDAVRVFSRDKVGALLVFERLSGLEDRIETGVAIDGLVSSGLLQNIFVKDTPLHDGAVVIRGNRIVAACCLLPLTENRNLSQELGTRHRAALGVSEQSDAVVLVVSEENGTISLGRNGELLRFLTREDARRILQQDLVTHNEDIWSQWRRKWQEGRERKE